MVSGYNININCSAFLTLACVTGGGYFEGFSKVSDDILEYKEGNGWGKLGAMKNGRSANGISLVNFKDFPNCN